MRAELARRPWPVPGEIGADYSPGAPNCNAAKRRKIGRRRRRNDAVCGSSIHNACRILPPPPGGGRYRRPSPSLNNADAKRRRWSVIRREPGGGEAESPHPGSCRIKSGGRCRPSPSRPPKGAGLLHVRAKRGLTSPRRGEVDPRRRRGSGEGITIYNVQRRPEPPHPIPLPCGAREENAARSELNAIALSSAAFRRCGTHRLMLDPMRENLRRRS